MIHRDHHIRLPSIFGLATLTACVLGGTLGCSDGDKGGYVDTLAAAGRGVNSKIPPGSAADVAGFNALPQSSGKGSGAFMDSRNIVPRGGAAGATGNVGGALGFGGLGNSGGAGGSAVQSGGAPSVGGTSGSGGSAGATQATGGSAGASAGNGGTSG